MKEKILKILEQRFHECYENGERGEFVFQQQFNNIATEIAEMIESDNQNKFKKIVEV